MKDKTIGQPNRAIPEMPDNKQANINAQRQAAHPSKSRTFLSESGNPRNDSRTTIKPTAAFGKNNQFQLAIVNTADASVGPIVNEIATTVA